MSKIKEKFLEIVSEKEGTLLEPYVDRWTQVRVKCKRGHIWRPVPKNIVYNYTWCPTCSFRSRIRLKRKFEEAVTEKNGIILTDCRKIFLPVTVQCQNEHTWTTTPQDVIDGLWCSECDLTIEVVVDFEFEWFPEREVDFDIDFMF
jgi:hypothetical protein